MKVYEIRPVCDVYKALMVDRRGYKSEQEYDAAWQVLQFRGKPKEPWTPPQMYPINPMNPDPDFWQLLSSGDALVVGPTALEAVYPFVEMAGQALPLPLKGKELMICNVLQVYDCVDPERSEWRTIPGTNRRGALRTPHFVPDHMQISTLFKIPERLHMIYCWEATRDPEDEFKACVEKHRFTGLKFVPVWSDENG